jgi:hypothetical protein
MSGGVLSGTLEGKVVMEQGDYLKYAGVPELNFNRCATPPPDLHC